MPARDLAKVPGLKGTLGLVLPVMYFHSLMTSSSICCRVLQGHSAMLKAFHVLKDSADRKTSGLPVLIVGWLVLWALCLKLATCERPGTS